MALNYCSWDLAERVKHPPRGGHMCMETCINTGAPLHTHELSLIKKRKLLKGLSKGWREQKNQGHWDKNQGDHASPRQVWSACPHLTLPPESPKPSLQPCDSVTRIQRQQWEVSPQGILVLICVSGIWGAGGCLCCASPAHVLLNLVPKQSGPFLSCLPNYACRS